MHYQMRFYEYNYIVQNSQCIEWEWKKCEWSCGSNWGLNPRGLIYVTLRALNLILKAIEKHRNREMITDLCAKTSLQPQEKNGFGDGVVEGHKSGCFQMIMAWPQGQYQYKQESTVQEEYLGGRINRTRQLIRRWEKLQEDEKGNSRSCSFFQVGKGSGELVYC